MRLAERSHARASDPDTSHFAAETSLQDADLDIFEALTAADKSVPRGHTPREVVEILVARGRDSQSINSRFTKLREAGLIRYLLHSDGSVVKRITKKSGKPGRVHIVGDGRDDTIFHPPTRLEKAILEIKILTAENARLKARLSELDGFIRINRALQKRLRRKQ